MTERPYRPSQWPGEQDPPGGSRPPGPGPGQRPSGPAASQWPTGQGRTPSRPPGGLPPSDDYLPPELNPRGPGGGSGRVPPGRPRRRLRRVLVWVAAGLTLTLLLMSAGGYLLYRHYDSQISRIPVFGALAGGNRPGAAPNGAENVLLVGSDSRDGSGNSAFQGSGAERVSGQRSDTVILAHLYGHSDKAQLVSFPRDSYVTIPAWRDPKTGTQHASTKGKLNSAITAGGPSLLIATIEQLSRVRVDHYVQIDFAGFQSMVDKLGGVEVCLTQPAKEKDSGIDLPAGRQTIKGAQALAFVRQRKDLPGGDLDRIKRQQQFIGSIVRKVLSAGTLLNPVKLTGFLDAATQSVQVDSALSAGQLRSLALRLRHFTSGGVLFSTVPVSNPNATINRESFVLLDTAKAATLFEAIQRDKPPGAAAEPSAPVQTTQALTVKPAAVSVAVFNGAGTAGLGRRAATDLAGAGFVVVGAAGNRPGSATATTILYGATQSEAARTLAAALPGSTVRLDASLDRTLQVVVGSGYSGVTPVQVTTSAAPPAPAAAPPAGVTTAAADLCAR